MKKQIISSLAIIACICFLESGAFGQGTVLKVNVAPLLSNIYGDSDSWKNAFGVQAGVEALIPFNCDLPITAWGGVGISMQGPGWEDDWGEGLTKGLTRMWYLQVPLTGRYLFDNGFFVELGLQPAFLLAAKDTYNGDAYDVMEWFKTFDLGIPVGIGVLLPHNLGVALRVTPGVLNVNAGDYADLKDHNLVFALRILYTLFGEEN